MNSLFQLNPSDKLTFTLTLFNPAVASLLITNTTGGPIAFKVKTTQPNLYYVSPNQDVIPSSGTFKVQISIVDNMKSSLIEAFMNGQKENSERHRFQVQGKAITENVYTQLRALDEARWEKKEGNEGEEFKQVSADRAARFAEVWNGVPKEDPNNVKLKVDYVYDVSSSSSSLEDKVNRDMESIKEKYGGQGANTTADSGSVVPSVSTHVEQVRARLARERAVHSDIADRSEGLPANQEAAMRELHSLRKKFEAVSDYTMQLTAERDSLKAKFEALQREISREDSRRGQEEAHHTASNTAGSSSLGGSDVTEGQNAQKSNSGFLPGIFTLVATVVVAYLLGRSMAAAHFFHGMFGYGM